MTSERLSTSQSLAGLCGVAISLAVGCEADYVPQAEFWPAQAEIGSPGGSGAEGGGAGGSVVDAGQREGAPGSVLVEAGESGAKGDSGSDGMASIDGGDSGDGSALPSLEFDSGLPEGMCLSVTVTTVSPKGRYSPRNVGAIWIAGPTGAFVKSLAVWGRDERGQLQAWNRATSQAGLSGNTVDAVTGATMSSHQTHTVTWNCADTKESKVPDGAYTVWLEVTDQNAAGPKASVPFTKGPAPVLISPPDQANFKGVTLVYAP